MPDLRDEVIQVLVRLLSQLPPELRPLIGEGLGAAARYMPIWGVPAVCCFVLVAVLGVRLYVGVLDNPYD